MVLVYLDRTLSSSKNRLTILHHPSIPARASSIAHFQGSELLRAATPLKGKMSTEHSVAPRRLLLVCFLCLALCWAADFAQRLSDALQYNRAEPSQAISWGAGWRVYYSDRRARRLEIWRAVHGTHDVEVSTWCERARADPL